EALAMSDSNATGLAHPGRRTLRANRVLTIVLLIAICALGNVLAARHLGVRKDLSADGLNEISDATRRVVERIEDRMTVRLFATQEVADGRLALRTARVRAQLDEVLALRPTVFDLQVLDPSTSSEARRNAREAGLAPTRGSTTGLGGDADEDVWLGLVLGYRGRTEVVPAPEPWRFEVQVASAMHALLSDRKIGVAWLGAPFDVPPDSPEPEVAKYASTFRLIQRELARRARLVPLGGLATGTPVPDDVDVLFVVRPGPLHPRTVYAIDQFVQRGGRLVVCLDDRDYNLVYPKADISQDDFAVSPLARLLEAWGIRVADKHVWDDEWETRRIAVVRGRVGLVVDPQVVSVPPEGLESDLPPTSGLAGVQFSWAHPLFPADLLATPDGVTRTDLAWSSEDARVVDPAPSLIQDPAEIRSLRSAIRVRAGARHVFGAVFEGRFPSPWAGEKPPEARQMFGERDDPPPRSAEVATQVVVFGDADWLRDPPEGQELFFAAGGGLLALNLVDWLTLDEDLIQLRSRAPARRPLRDFVLEEERALGLYREDVFVKEAERIEADRKSDLARRRAQRKQWLTMLAPATVALLLVALFGVAWSQWRSRGIRGGRA
ncbi:MAG: Gldg family protein, partial [Planctomycetota bacterium]